MKLAILADIHANADALEAVLAESDRLGCEKLILLGDLIGYYYQPGAVMEMLVPRSPIAIAGNHERLFFESLEDTAAAQSYKSKYGSGLVAARDQLPIALVDWLRNLPERQSLLLDGINFELCHGSPRSRDEYVYPDAKADQLQTCRVPGADFVLMAHTHYAFINQDQRPVLLNPGSVGQSRDRGGSAAWCLFDTLARQAELRRTTYDTSRVIAAALRLDPDLPYLQFILTRGLLA